MPTPRAGTYMRHNCTQVERAECGPPPPVSNADVEGRGWGHPPEHFHVAALHAVQVKNKILSQLRRGWGGWVGWVGEWGGWVGCVCVCVGGGGVARTHAVDMQALAVEPSSLDAP